MCEKKLYNYDVPCIASHVPLEDALKTVWNVSNSEVNETVSSRAFKFCPWSNMYLFLPQYLFDI